MSIDVWTESEEADCRTLVNARDVAKNMIVLSDLQPPVVCRYLRVSHDFGGVTNFFPLSCVDQNS